MSTGDVIWFMQMRDALDSLESAVRYLDGNDETDIAADVESAAYELRKRMERVRNEGAKP